MRGGLFAQALHNKVRPVVKAVQTQEAMAALLR